MHRDQFLETYPRRLHDSLLDVTIGDVDLGESRRWSQKFGEILHDRLRGKEPVEDMASVHAQYEPWVLTRFIQISHAAERAADDARASRAANELNFHNLNSIMFGAWALMEDNPQLAKDRGAVIKAAQDSLAMRGYHLYAARDEVAGPDTNYSYFDPKNRFRRQMFEGRANEFDAAIVLLEVMRRNKDLIVVPGPIQFESYGRNTREVIPKRTNVDFVVIKKEQAVGVQVKGHVNHTSYQDYDQRRVVLLDAALDLGNERVMRTSPRSSQRNKVAWGGMICTQRVAAIPTHGRNAYLHQLDRNETLRTLFKAKQLVGGTKPYFETATKIMSSRINYALEATRFPPDA